MGLFPWVSKAENKSGHESVYRFSFERLDEEGKIDLMDYKGKVILIVNTASECGFTSQYDGLEKLYKKYNQAGLEIIGIPSNDFGGQEPGANHEIARFCRLNYGVTFPMAAKQVVTGNKAHPFYRTAADVLGFGTSPKWNFHKYLISKEGFLIDYFNSTTGPDSERLVKAIEQQLNKNSDISVK